MKNITLKPAFRFGRLTVIVLLASSLFCLSVTAQDVLNVKNDKVGVRTDDPQVPLHVVLSGTPFALHPVTTMAFQNNANTTDAVVFSLIGGTAANAQINFANSGDEFAGRIIYSFGIQAMRFFNGPTEKMRITSSGDVGIGTTTPAGKLDVNGAIYQRGGVVHPDFVFEPAYQLETIEEHEAYMWENKHLPAVGKGRYDEQGRSIIEVGKQSASILEELEKAHLYIAQLNTELKNERLEKERSMAELDERLARLEALLAAQNTVQ